MCQPYIDSATALSDYYFKDTNKFVILSGCRKPLPALSCTHKCECRLEINDTVFV